MAVPKKKMSKARRDSRKSNWKNKVLKQITVAISLGKALAKGSSTNFLVP